MRRYVQVKSVVPKGFSVDQRLRPENDPGVSSPTRSGPMLASLVLDDRWAHLRDGAFVVKDEEREVKPFAKDLAHESRLWEATAELLAAAD